jgi:hypothetical protein
MTRTEKKFFFPRSSNESRKMRFSPAGRQMWPCSSSDYFFLYLSLELLSFSWSYSRTYGITSDDSLRAYICSSHPLVAHQSIFWVECTPGAARACRFFPDAWGRWWPVPTDTSLAWPWSTGVIAYIFG